MGDALHILILEDNPADVELVQRELRKAGLNFTPDVVNDQASFLHSLDASAPDLLLADYSLPGFHGLAALAFARQRLPHLPVVIVSGAIGEETAIEALKAGATDYVLKQRLSRLGTVIERALREERQRRDQERAEQELARQKEWLRVTLRSIGDAVLAADNEGRISFLNPMGERLTGYRAEEAVGLPSREVLRVINEQTRQPADDVVARVLREGRAIVLANHMTLLAMNGPETPIEDSAAPIMDDAGKTVGVVVVFHDVTQKRRAAEAMAESESQLRLLFEGVRDYAIFMLTPEGKVMRWNAGAQRIFQWSGGEIVGRNHSVFYAQEDVAAGKPQRALEEAKILGRHEEQGRRVRRDGSIYWAHVTITPVHDEEGELRGFAKVVRDISESKRIEDELHAAKLSAEEAREDAEAANRAKDHFLAVLSHELRTPLTPALAVVSMLQENTRFDPDTRENLEVIRRNIDLEARLIEDLLDVSRIEQGKVELYRQTMALCTIINRAVEVCLPDIQARQLEFGVNNPDGPYLVDVDPARLQQVFWNLLKNAVKFTPHGGCVGIQCRRDGEHHVIAEVIDSGEGIHPDMLTRIFRPFEQEGRHITHQFGGLGLGLAISKAILDLHGGTISAHSEGKGKGARFTVRLPISRTAPSLPAPSGSPEQAAAAATRRKLAILLVEDHGDTARIMKRLLSAEGHDVRTAGDVATALDLAGSCKFDLLLSDLGLPDGSGVDLMRELRRRGNNLLGIALSGYGQEEDIRRSKEAGFVAHLTKPTNPAHLTDVIASVLTSKQRGE